MRGATVLATNSSLLLKRRPYACMRCNQAKTRYASPNTVWYALVSNCNCIYRYSPEGIEYGIDITQEGNKTNQTINEDAYTTGGMAHCQSNRLAVVALLSFSFTYIRTKENKPATIVVLKSRCSSVIESCAPINTATQQQMHMREHSQPPMQEGGRWWRGSHSPIVLCTCCAWSN